MAGSRRTRRIWNTSTSVIEPCANILLLEQYSIYEMLWEFEVARIKYTVSIRSCAYKGMEAWRSPYIRFTHQTTQVPTLLQTAVVQLSPLPSVSKSRSNPGDLKQSSTSFVSKVLSVTRNTLTFIMKISTCMKVRKIRVRKDLKPRACGKASTGQVVASLSSILRMHPLFHPSGRARGGGGSWSGVSRQC